MPLYEQYADSREPLHEKEEALVREAKVQRGDGPIINTASYRNGRVIMDDPVLNAYAKIAYNRAEWDLQQIHMPTTRNLDRDFPGIDPDGKHCRVDMSFAQRIARLKGAASLCRDVNKEVLDDFLRSYREHSGRLGALMRAVDKTCHNIQLTEHAAIACPDKTTSHFLENAAEQIARKSPEIQLMDKIFTAMEQVAGLRSGSLDPNTINAYNQLRPQVPLYPQLNTGVAAKRFAPETVAVNFQNFDNIARQNYYAKPENWGFKALTLIPKEPTDSLALAACMRRYAGGTAANALNSLFAPTELNNLKASNSANRATLTIVDGKTVSERMQEIYNNLPDSRPGFEEWCAEHLKEKLIDEDQFRKYITPRDAVNFNPHECEEKFNALETKMRNIYNGLGEDPEKPSFAQWRADNMWKLFKTVADPELLQTMQAKMEAGYNSAPKKTPYSQWYSENLERMSSEIVASGLMAGKRVEAYIPSPDGKLPDQPTVLHKTGYTPSPERPVTLNAWERFFNKFGFYKEKAAQAKEHSDRLAARERLKANYTAIQHNRLAGTNGAVKEMFFGEYLRRNNIPDMEELAKLTAPNSHFRLNRSADSTACICMLAAQGHDIRDIMDPTKLQTEKKAAGEEYLRNAFMDPATGQPGVDNAHRIGNDPWLGDVFFRGQLALRNQVNNIMAQTDLTDPTHRQTVLPMVCAAVGTMFDSFQEATYNSATSQVYVGYLQSAHAEAARTNDPAGGDVLASNLMKDINRMSFFFKKLEDADKARAALTNPATSENNIYSAVPALVTEQVVLATVDPATNRPFTDRLPPCENGGAVEKALRENRTIFTVCEKLANRRGNWKADADMILSGEFAKSISVNADVRPGPDPQIDTMDYLRRAPDGSHYVEQIPQISQRPEATINVVVSPSMSKKLGIPAPQANRNTAAAR